MSNATKQSSVSPAELPALTGIRFFAAAYVVLYHFCSAFFPSGSASSSIISAGYTAVGFFFLLSGFVLAYSYAGRTNSHGAKQFWFARWARIYPAYLLAFLLAAPMQIAGSIHVNGLSIAVSKLAVGAFLHLTLLQAWTPWTAWYWNIPAWSLSAEAFFYFCFPFLLIPVLRLSRRSAWLLVAALFLATLAVPALYLAFLHPVAQPPLPALQLAIEVNPLLRLPEFAIGMLLGYLFASGWRMSRRLAVWGPLTAVAAACLLLATVPLPRPLLANGLLLPLSAFLILALAQNSGPVARFLSLPALRVGGEASYGIYILQMPVAGLLGVLPGTIVPGTGQGWRLLVFMLVLVIVAVVSHFAIETPLRRALMSWFDKQFARQPLASPLTPTGGFVGSNA